MRKKLLALAAVVILAAITVSGSLAYFTAKDTARNVITSGGIKIELVEQTLDGSGALVAFPKEGITGIMPGSSASKIVQVKNTGPNEAWIRVKVEPSIVGADGEPLPMTLEGGIPVMTYETLEGWTEKDGCYYYGKPVASGELTAELLKEITFAPQMGNAYQNCTANIVITAQAVQTAHNGETALEAKGWPEA